MRSFTFRPSKFAVGLMVLVGLGCSKTNNVDQSQKTTFEQKVGPNGGFVGEETGLGVYIPPGALTGEKLISLATAAGDEYPALPSDANAIGEVYSFQPHGLTFTAPATLHLPLPEGQVGTALRAQPGGSWAPISGAVSTEGNTAWFESIGFSFYVLTAGNGTTPAAGADGGQDDAGGTGTPGGGGTAGVTGTGGMSGNSGTTGAGGTTGGDTCPPGPDDAAPVGPPPVAMGSFNGINFTAMDGFAVISDEGGLATLMLVFADHEKACGYAMANQMSLQGGKIQNGLRLSSQMVAGGFRLTTPGAQPMGGGTTYTGQTGEFMMFPLEFKTWDGTCGPGPDMFAFPNPNQYSITIDTLDTSHVTGTVDAPDAGDGNTFSASFDFPLCQLPQQAPPSQCCLP